MRFIILLLLNILTFQAQGIKWRSLYLQNEPQANTVSSLSSAYLNTDNIPDYIFGTDDADTCYIVAIDGNNGNTLWYLQISYGVFNKIRTIDLTGDGIKDIILGGRTGELYALDAVNGNIIWKFDTTQYYPTTNGWQNFYTPQFVGDYDNDGYPDLLFANGGNPNYSQSDSARQPGTLVLISSKTGQVIAIDTLPDGKETYMSPLFYDLNKDGQKEIIFGTGGEKFSGSLYLTRLSNLLNDNLETSYKLKNGYIGYIQPPVITDLNNDTYPDILANAGGYFVAISGKDSSVLWQKSFPGYESYTQPTPGFYNNDSVPDFYTKLLKGAFPAYTQVKNIWIDGKTGAVTEVDSINLLGPPTLASAISLDIDNDSLDEVISPEVLFQNNNTYFYLRIYDINDGTSLPLSDTIAGENFYSTPYFIKNPNDNFGTLTYGMLVFDTLTSKYLPLITQIDSIPCYKVSWNAYMGSDSRSVFLPYSLTTKIPDFTNNTQIKIFPNPVKNKLQIQTNHKIFQVEIYSPAGKKISTLAKQEKFYLLPENLSEGFYFLRINGEETTQWHPVIITK